MALDPEYTTDDIKQLDSNSRVYRVPSGDEYLPGVMGMNVIGKTDYINVVVEALSHVTPIRDFFLFHQLSYSKVLFHNGFQFRVLLFMLLVFS